jgi:nucleoid DNA-binding protein
MEGMPISKAKRIVGLTIDCIIYALKSDKKVVLTNLGSITTKYKPGRNGIHPRKLTPIQVQPSVAIKFTPSNSIKQGVKPLLDVHTERYKEGQNS